VQTFRLSRVGRRAVRDGLVLAGLLFCGYLFLVTAPQTNTVGFDAYAYWAVNPADPYPATRGLLGAFRYSPVFVRLFAPFGAFPFWQFLWVWEALLLGTVIWLGGRWWLAVLAFPAVAVDLYHGNIHVLMAAAIALGFRYPASWAFILLSKVTPGVALAWFAFRREWRKLAIALGATAAIAVVSFAVDSSLWMAWIAGSLAPTATGAPLNQMVIPIPLWIRLPAALVLVAWGARSDRPWTVPASATIALPVLWPAGFAVLAACWPLYQRRRGLTSDDVTLGWPR